MIQKVLPYFKKYGSQSDSIPIIVGGDMNSPSHLDWNKKTKKIHNDLVVPWYATKIFENLGFSPVFWTMLLSKFGFGLVAWLLLALIIGINIWLVFVCLPFDGRKWWCADKFKCILPEGYAVQ